MGEICLGIAASHSPILFVSPEKWLARIHQGESREDEPDSFKLTTENISKTILQIQRCHDAYKALGNLLQEAKPDALVIIGDDQGENFYPGNMPPLAICVGADLEGSFSLGRRLPIEEQEDVRRVKVPSDELLAKQIYQEFIDCELDVASSLQLPGEGLGHAHMWPLKFLAPELNIPIVPIFINAYFPPQPRAGRCYLLGAVLANAIRKSNKRVAVFGSGGLSHFPRHLGPWGISPYPIEKRWFVDEEFDRHALSMLVTGRGAELANASSIELERSGNLELRNWIALSGAMGERKGRLLAYEPVRTVAIGLGFAVWN